MASTTTPDWDFALDLARRTSKMRRAWDLPFLPRRRSAETAACAATDLAAVDLASATLSWADRGITIRDFTMKGSQPIRSRPMHSLRQQTTTLPRMNTPHRMHTPRTTPPPSFPARLFPPAHPNTPPP